MRGRRSELRFADVSGGGTLEGRCLRAARLIAR